MDTYADKNYRLLFDTEGEWYCNDARTIEPERMPDFDLLCAGFPCQAFSIAGKREGFADARGTLFFEIARILEAKRPSYFILENVPGLLSHDKGRTFCTILSTLSELGYHVEWKVLNSKDFGVPQARKRVYIVGYFDFRCAGKVLPEPETNGAALVQVRAGSQGKRVYSPKGLSCTLTSQAGGMGGKRDKYRLSLGGIAAPKENTQIQSECFKKLPDALEEFLKNHPEIKEIEICTDNDFAGRWAKEQMKKHYEGTYQIICNLPEKEGADYADLAKEKKQTNKCRDRPLERR